MRLERYNILNNMLVLKFDRKFKHIKLVKLELVDESKVETDNLEMKFSKEKDEIILFVKDSIVFVMLYINMVDNIESSDAFYIKCETNNNINTDTKREGMMGMGMGDIGMLIKSKAGDFFKEEKVDDKRVCLIKSENIFAEINRREIK